LTEWATGESVTAFVLRGSVPQRSSSGIVIFPQQTKQYELGLAEYKPRFGTSVNYLALQVTYASQFGTHWTYHLLRWYKQRNMWGLESTEIGDGEPPKRWSNETGVQGSQGNGQLRIAPATDLPDAQRELLR